MNLDPAQRARLQAAKLSALARGVGASPEEPREVGSFCAATDGVNAFILLDSVGPGDLAGSLLWALRQAATSLTVFVDGDGADLARWASYFELAGGTVQVRAVDGAASRLVSPSRVPAVRDAPEIPAELQAVLDDAGVEVVHEWGVTRGEVLGLEVARLVEWPTETGGDGELHLEAGVGRFDRDAMAAAHPDAAPAESLARAVDAVRRHRYPGAPTHALQRLARSRWLRSVAVADPGLIGARSLEPIGLSVEAEGLKDQHPAAAAGTDADGAPLIAVFSSGVDLGVVPLAADTRAMVDPAAELRIVAPPQDLHAATLRLIEALREPANTVALDAPWG